MTRHQLARLLKHEPFLRRLAHRLLRDASRADDVVQEAWLVALRSDKSPDQVNRGWLAGIVRNLVRRLRRDDARRRRREEKAARTVLVRSTEEAFTQRIVRRRLAELVLALPEHYRDVLLLRYYDDLEPIAIAQRLGIAPSTVRTRLQRGVAMVRTRLTAESGGLPKSLLAAIATGVGASSAGAAWRTGAAAAVLVTAGWLGLRLDVVEQPRAPVALEARHMSRGGAGAVRRVVVDPVEEGFDPPAEARRLIGRVRLPAGVATYAVELTITGEGSLGEVRAVVGESFAVDVDVLGEPTWLRVRAAHPETDELVKRVPVGQPVVLELRRRPLVPASELTPAARVASKDGASSGFFASPEAEGAGDVRLSAQVYLRGVVHAPGPVVLVEVCRGAACVRARVAVGRVFRVAVGRLLRAPLPAALVVHAAQPDALPARAEAAVFVGPSVAPVELVLEPARTLRGTVAFAEEGPAEGATVAAYAMATEPEPAPFATAVTDAEGRFALPVEPEGVYAVVAAVAGWAPAVLPEAPEMSFVLRRGVAIEGRAGEGRVRATGALAEAELVLGESRLAWAPGDARWLEVAADVDGEGRYVLGGLAPGVYEVAYGAETREVTAPGTADFVAGEPVRFAVTVRGAGPPLPGASVVVSGRSVGTDGAGRATVELPPAKDYRVTASAEGYRSETKTVQSTEAEFDLEPESQLATLTVTLQASGLAPLPATCAFGLQRSASVTWPGFGFAFPSLAPPIQRAVGATGDRFVLEDLEPGQYALTANPGGGYFPAETQVTLKTGETTQINLPVELGGRLRVEVSDPNGNPVPAMLVVSGQGSWTQLLINEPALPQAPGGRTPFAMPPKRPSELLRPGAYTLWLQPLDPMHQTQSASVHVLPGLTVPVSFEVGGTTYQPQSPENLLRGLAGLR